MIGAAFNNFFTSGIRLWLPSATATSGINAMGWLTTITIGIAILMLLVLWIVLKARTFFSQYSQKDSKPPMPDEYLEELSPSELSMLLKLRNADKKHSPRSTSGKAAAIFPVLFLLIPMVAESAERDGADLFAQPGIIITVVLILIPLVASVVFLIMRINNLLNTYRRRAKEREARQLAEYLLDPDSKDLESFLAARKRFLQDPLTHKELSGELAADDPGGIIRKSSSHAGIPFVAAKKKASTRPNIDPGLSRLVIWYLGCAIFWLVFGTTVGECLGIKFLAPDLDQQSWLSFGRLRPVHTNAVFWGWSSLAMLGLGYYIVPIVSNVAIASLRKGWISLALINTSVIVGTICLMAGINNGGGEYREYIWPVMALFGAGLVLTLVNYIKTIARRATREIYISNWYIVSAVMFTIVIAFIAYWPSWQDGLGETIVQGYYMHQGVGMWFMLFTLGIVYYFLPQQLNKPIYSYSLGILAFWTQVLFYTVIGTHHFVFSSIPWSLQTVAIVGSMGMVIPVVAGTTNFLLTFKGDFHRLGSSYTLPFFLVGIIFYFTGSLQGTAEAFRFTNLLWHFTDFTVAHSHMTMYGIIAFLLWGSVYAVMPRLTGKEPSQLMVGAHFWIAFIGLLLYSIPLMIGGTLKGLAWMDGKPFIETVTMMAPYWLWRAIGGSMMWIAHIIFAANFYQMIRSSRQRDVKTLAFEKVRETRIDELEAMPVN